MAVNRMFRVCPSTGLTFHQPAEALMKANAVAGVVALLVGGILALLVTLTRWQYVHLLAPDSFYLVLTAHGLNMPVFWIIFFEIAILYFAASTLLRCRLATPNMAWVGFLQFLAEIDAVHRLTKPMVDTTMMFVRSVHLPAGMPHYAHAAVETVVQINGTGPFDVVYVDPKDDPRKK